MLNASIDLRQQILATPALQPKGAGRHSPIGAVVLTNAEVDSSAGLLALRERQPLVLFGTQATLDAIGANRMFDVVDRAVAPRRAVRLGEQFEPLPGIKLELFAIPGKVPLWLEEGNVSTDDIGEGTVCVAAEAAGMKLVYAPGLRPCYGGPQRSHRQCGCVVFRRHAVRRRRNDRQWPWRQNREAHGPYAPCRDQEERSSRLRATRSVRRILIHINNSNPILIEGSPEEAKVKAAGWEIAFDGMEVCP